MQRYHLENELGEGAFGTVFRAIKISNHQEVGVYVCCCVVRSIRIYIIIHIYFVVGAFHGLVIL